MSTKACLRHCVMTSTPRTIKFFSRSQIANVIMYGRLTKSTLQILQHGARLDLIHQPLKFIQVWKVPDVNPLS